MDDDRQRHDQDAEGASFGNVGHNHEYRQGGNMQRVYRMIEDGIKGEDMAELSGLSHEQVLRARENLLYTGQVEIVKGTSKSKGLHKGRTMYQLRVVHRLHARIKPREKKPAQMLGSVWDLAK